MVECGVEAKLDADWPGRIFLTTPNLRLDYANDTRMIYDTICLLWWLFITNIINATIIAVTFMINQSILIDLT